MVWFFNNPKLLGWFFCKFLFGYFLNVLLKICHNLMLVFSSPWIVRVRIWLPKEPALIFRVVRVIHGFNWVQKWQSILFLQISWLKTFCMFSRDFKKEKTVVCPLSETLITNNGDSWYSSGVFWYYTNLCLSGKHIFMYSSLTKICASLHNIFQSLYLMEKCFW